jgi:hypothetical protein
MAAEVATKIAFFQIEGSQREPADRTAGADESGQKSCDPAGGDGVEGILRQFHRRIAWTVSYRL